LPISIPSIPIGAGFSSSPCSMLLVSCSFLKVHLGPLVGFE
jgi:hypothetical protein